MLETQLSSKTSQLSVVTAELDSLKEQLSTMTQAKAKVESTLEQQAGSHSSEVAQLWEELTTMKEELRVGGAREEELKAMLDTQANEMGITLERYKVPLLFYLSFCLSFIFPFLLSIFRWKIHTLWL